MVSLQCSKSSSFANLHVIPFSVKMDEGLHERVANWMFVSLLNPELRREIHARWTHHIIDVFTVQD
jgi:hypothetical protein